MINPGTAAVKGNWQLGAANYLDTSGNEEVSEVCLGWPNQRPGQIYLTGSGATIRRKARPVGKAGDKALPV